MEVIDGVSGTVMPSMTSQGYGRVGLEGQNGMMAGEPRQAQWNQAEQSNSSRSRVTVGVGVGVGVDIRALACEQGEVGVGLEERRPTSHGTQSPSVARAAPT